MKLRLPSSDFISPTDRCTGNVVPSLRRAGDFAADADDLLLARREVMVKIPVVALAVGARHQHVDVAAQHLADAIAEQPLRRRVECLNRPAIVDDDDAVDRRFDDRPHALFALAERLLDLRLAGSDREGCR